MMEPSATYIQHKQPRRLTFWKCMAVTALSYAASKTVTAPLERVKLILQVGPILKTEQQFTGILKTFSTVYSTQGLLAFWRGNAMNIFKTVPNAALRFTAYDKFKQYSSEYRKKETYSRQVINRLVAGVSTGVLNLLFHYPLDTLRVKMSLDLSHLNRQRLYSSYFDCLKKTLRNQGVTGLYQGWTVSALGSVPYLAIGFLIHDHLKDQMSSNALDETVHQFLALLGIGTLSTIGSVSLTYPLDTVRRRQQMNGSLGAQRAYFSIRDCFKKIAKQEGLAGFYRGFWISLLRIIPAASVQFACFDYLKELTT